MSGSVRRPSHRQASATTSILASEDVAMSESSSSAPPRKQGPASVAIDLGSYSIRICITGAEGKPPIITRCPNALVKPSQKRYSGASGSGLLAGPQIKQHCTNFGSLSIRQPMDRGMIIDWPTQKLILDAALMGALGQEKSGSKSDQRLLEGREVIVTEAYLNMPDLQAGLDILFFEGYGASKIWRCARKCVVSFDVDKSFSNAYKQLHC
jgi:actin-related protein